MKKIIIISLIIWRSVFSYGQDSSTFYYMEGQWLDSLPENLYWYALLPNSTIVEYQPELLDIVDEDSGLFTTIINYKLGASLLIARQEKLKTENMVNSIPSVRALTTKNKLELTDNEFLVAKSIKSEDEVDEIYSLFICTKEGKEKYKILNNCRILETNNEYYGCGKVPFLIRFYGSLNEDGNPEILLSADKEGGTLDILISKVNHKYKVVYFYQSE